MNSHTDTTSAPASARSVDLNTVQSDVWHLFHLLDATVDCLQELNFVRNEKGYCPLDRLAALAWIARDLSEKLGQDIDGNFRQIERGAAR